MRTNTPEWQRFFRHEAPRYLDEVFTRNTVREVDFIIRELGCKPGQEILDVGCGTGRHALELAMRGFRCTGIDQSPDMLEIGQRKADEQGVAVDFVLGEASSIRLRKSFDHAICLCEGAFSLLEMGMDPVLYHKSILDNIVFMLKESGMFLLTVLNGLRFIRKYSDADVERGIFDPVSISAVEDIPIEGSGPIKVVEKGFTPHELKRVLEDSGFAVQGIWGGTAGSWNKEPVKLDEIELMALCRKQ
jgi:2-polyprenyl-3-methyl-5-hydroxy-6-metoxy-1,4-benzoquinol methylase